MLMATAATDDDKSDGRGLRLRAHVWVEARHLFSRTEAQEFGWLWLLGEDGRVQAAKIAAAHAGSPHLPHLLLVRQTATADLPPADDQPPGPLWLLPGAPVVPAPRWSVSWGHPLAAALRRFAARLDADVLAVLGQLEVPGPFFGSVGNYNRLACLPAQVRERRLQALALFPPLIAPLLLDVYSRPDIHGTDEDQPIAHAALDPGTNHPVLAAIDHGRDLIGALAAHYHVGRSLIRSRLFREPWITGHVSRQTLRLLDAIPPPARPRTRAALERHLDLLHALPLDASQDADIVRLAPAFSGGWDALWESLESVDPNLRTALRDTRDFLRAVLEQVELPPALPRLDMFRLALAWLARRGLPSLLAASRRWHLQPLLEEEGDDGLPDKVMPIFDSWHCELGHATELLCRRDLIAEGQAMRHCVGGYWRHCVHSPLRIVHLDMADGTRATASYRIAGYAENAPRFDLDELRGPHNAEGTLAQNLLAQQVAALINSDPFRLRRCEVAAEAARRVATWQPQPARRIRPLDARSRQQSRLVLAWAAAQDDWRECSTDLLRDHVAGFGYHDGPGVCARIAVGDALQLVREAGNVHDRAAVRIDWNGRTLGYVARKSNIPIAAYLDAGRALHARVTQVRIGTDPWQAVEFAIRLA